MSVEAKNLTFKVPLAPTIDEYYGASVPVKHNYSNYTFEIQVFKGLSQITPQWVNDKAKNNKDGTFIREGGISRKGFINLWTVNK